MEANQPTERIQYAGQWWLARNEDTLRRVRASFDNGTFSKVFALEALEGNLFVDKNGEQ